jgi:large subunit ribosomal protein L25
VHAQEAGHDQNGRGGGRLLLDQREDELMATVKELKATARQRAGKGAARALRRQGSVPGVIYGGDQPPVPIALEHIAVRNNIYAGRFLTTIYHLDLDGQTHRVIPRDYQLDPVKGLPLHVDFLRLTEGARIRVRVPVHLKNADQAPGVKRGGTINTVEHSVELLCPADAIPSAIDVDLTGLEMNRSVHLSEVTLPDNVKPATGRDVTLVTIVAPSGYLEEQRAAAEAAAAAATTAAQAPAAGEGAAAGPSAPGAPGAAASAPAGGAPEKK